jgi:hypothetical protein
MPVLSRWTGGAGDAYDVDAEVTAAADAVLPRCPCPAQPASNTQLSAPNVTEARREHRIGHRVSRARPASAAARVRDLARTPGSM